MKFIIQRVDNACVNVDENTVGSIQKGYLVLMGVGINDTKETADKMLNKLLNLRIFSDENGKTNLNISQAGGELLIVSQFTLYANCKKGNRPSFTEAGDPQTAEMLYEYVISEAKKKGIRVKSGVFGAHMSVTLTNNGPFTIILDSDIIF